MNQATNKGVDSVVINDRCHVYLRRHRWRHPLQHDVGVRVNIALIDLTLVQVVPQDDLVLLEV